tara:strand:- start:176 stop:625 length:450 start_codon:yes stop_codon:yes gene_type:complete
MKLETEIKQKKFKSEYEKLIVNILFTSSWLAGKHIQFLKPFGLSHQQYNVMRILRGQYPDPASIGLICERMLDKNSNASRLVEKLVQKKLADRTVSSYDRRQKDVIITEKGLALLEDVDKSFSVFEKQLQTLTVDETVQLNTLLDNFRG